MFAISLFSLNLKAKVATSFQLVMVYWSNCVLILSILGLYKLRCSKLLRYILLVIDLNWWNFLDQRWRLMRLIHVRFSGLFLRNLN
jgi:hypothetical protein